MSWDFLNSENEEVKRAFSQISETEKALREAIDNYHSSVMKVRYLTGEGICADPQIPDPAHCRTYGTHGRYLSLLSMDATSSIPNPASARPSSNNMRHVEKPF